MRVEGKVGWKLLLGFLADKGGGFVREVNAEVVEEYSNEGELEAYSRMLARGQVDDGAHLRFHL
jgi:hypothetical protein